MADAAALHRAEGLHAVDAHWLELLDSLNEWRSDAPLIQRAADGSTFIEMAGTPAADAMFAANEPWTVAARRQEIRRAAALYDRLPRWTAPQLAEIADWRKAWASPILVELPDFPAWRNRVIAAVAYPDVEITVSMPYDFIFWRYEMDTARIDIVWPQMGVRTWATYPLQRAPEDVAREIRDYIDDRLEANRPK